MFIISGSSNLTISWTAVNETILSILGMCVAQCCSRSNSGSNRISASCQIWNIVRVYKVKTPGTAKGTLKITKAILANQDGPKQDIRTNALSLRGKRQMIWCVPFPVVSYFIREVQMCCAQLWKLEHFKCFKCTPLIAWTL